MNKTKSPRDLLNEELAAVEWSQKNMQAVLRTTEGGGQLVMKKKMTLILAMVLAIAMVTTSAFAVVGLLFSPRYDALQLANQALMNKYGITEEMQPGLIHTISEESGATIVTYNVAEHTVMRENRFGTYTVTVRNGKAEAVWSMDGIDTSGGLDAPAWGAEQLLMYVQDYSTVMSYMEPRGMLTSLSFDEALFIQQATQWEQDKETALAMANITPDMAAAIARDAIVAQYGLNAQQLAMLMHYTGEEDESTYKMTEGRPLVNMFFHLSQRSGVWMEKDGVYVVTINLLDGAVEDVYYDNGLIGNG